MFGRILGAKKERQGTNFDDFSLTLLFLAKNMKIDF